MNNDCRKTQDALAAYHDGELSSAESKVLKTHLSSCAGCRAQEASARRTWELFSSAHPRRALPPALRDNPYAPAQKSSWLPWGTALAAACALLALSLRTPRSVTVTQSLPLPAGPESGLPQAPVYAEAAPAALAAPPRPPRVPPPPSERILEKETGLPQAPRLGEGPSRLRFAPLPAQDDTGYAPPELRWAGPDLRTESLYAIAKEELA